MVVLHVVRQLDVDLAYKTDPCPINLWAAFVTVNNVAPSTVVASDKKGKLSGTKLALDRLFVIHIFGHKQVIVGVAGVGNFLQPANFIALQQLVLLLVSDHQRWICSHISLSA